MTTSQAISERIEGQTLPTRFLANLANHRDLEVLRWKDGGGVWHSWSLDQLADATARLAGGLADLGVGPGDRVALMVRNRPEFHALDIAALFLGATPLSIYNSSAPEQIEYLMNDCGAKVAVVEEDYLADFVALRDSLPRLGHLVVMGTNTGDGVAVPYAELAGHDPFDLDAAAATASPDDLATIIYTSGTTGPPKGVMLTHANILWTLESAGEELRAQTTLETFTGARHVSYLPMAHVFERLFGQYFLLDSATVVTCCPDSSELLEYTTAVRPSIVIGVPRVWEKVHAGVNAVVDADPDKATAFHDAVEAALPIVERMARGEATQEEVDTWNFLDEVAFRTVRNLIGLDEAIVCITGAAPLSPDILAWFRAIGVPLTEGYGLSETTSVVSWANVPKPGCVGRPLSGVEVVIADDGEVLCRGGNNFVGYVGRPDATSQALDAEGWMHSGDIGELDDDGYLKIIDRKRELIITAGGKNVSPANLEARLKAIPLVGQACVVGDRRPFVAALVVLDPDGAATWAAQHGLAGDDASVEALAANPELIAAMDAAVSEAMHEFSHAEAVKKVKVLAEEWLPDSDVLTPTSKLKRRGILARFADEIESLYAT